MRQVKSVIAQDRSSGRIHERLEQTRRGFDPDDPNREDRRWLVDERCQADQSGAWDALDTTVDEIQKRGLPGVDRALFCKYCLPGMR